MKFKKFLLLIILCLFGVLKVNATSLELETTDKKVVIKENEIYNILINLKDIDAPKAIDRIEFDFDYDKESLELNIPTDQYGHPISYEKGTVLVVKNKELTEGTFMSFTLKNISSEDGTTQLKLKNVKIDDTPIEDIVLDITLKKEVTTTTRAKNTSAALKSFKVTNSTQIKPAFSKDIFDYKVYVKDTIRQIIITPTYEQDNVLMDVECKVGCQSDSSMPNKLKLVKGKNEVTFTFTSEDEKDVKKYNFTIYCGETTDGSNLLSSLEIENVTINEKFDKKVIDYTATVPFDVETLNVIPVPEDENADVKVNGAEGLKVGENKVTVTVTSTDESVKPQKQIYTITITREEFKAEEEPTTAPAATIGEDVPKVIKKDNTMLILIIVGVCTLIIGIAAYFIFFYKGKKKKTKEPKAKGKVPVLRKEIIDEDREPTSVDAALEDLMMTKEIRQNDDEEL